MVKAKLISLLKLYLSLNTIIEKMVCVENRKLMRDQLQATALV